jgi:hypothetical protein
VAKYSVRDIFGHFVKPKARQGDLCPHQCCRNRRVHPDKLPVMLRPDMVRRLPEETLVEHYARVSDDPKAARQALAAIDKREQRDKAKTARAQGAKERAFARKLERHEHVERELLAAEKATSGNLVNKAGVRAGVSDVSLFTGSEARAMRYASGDLLAYWEDHPRPSSGLMSQNATVRARARGRSDMGRVERKRPRSHTGYADIY